MQYEEFIDQVKQRTGLQENEAAEQAVRATLETLSERMFGYEAQTLAGHLPGEFRVHLRQPPEKEHFPLREFYKRVARRESGDVEGAEMHARAVIDLIQQILPAVESSNLRAQFPEDYQPLFEFESQKAD